MPTSNPEENFVKVLTGIMLAAFATAAQASTFLCREDTTTKRGSVKGRPTVKTTIIVGKSGKVYATEVGAQNAMRTIEVCETR